MLTRTLILAEDALARTGLALIMSQQEGITVVGQVAGLDDLAEANELFRPEVGLWDVGAYFEQALLRLEKEKTIPLPLVILLPAYPGEHERTNRVPLSTASHFREMIFEGDIESQKKARLVGAAWQVAGNDTYGGFGILNRSTAPATIAQVLVSAAEGLDVFGPGLVSRIGQALRTSDANKGQNIRISPVNRLDGSAYETLTNREQEVLQLLAEGLTNKQIAARLGISENTIKYHVNSVFGKLNAESRTEAVMRAARLGWLKL